MLIHHFHRSHRDWHRKKRLAKEAAAASAAALDVETLEPGCELVIRECDTFEVAPGVVLHEGGSSPVLMRRGGRLAA